MYADLGDREATAVQDPSNPLGAGFWTATFTPQNLATQQQCEVYHIVISGPAGSSFQIYRGTKFWDYVDRGDRNSWDPSQPMPVHPGDSVYFYWNTGSGTAPSVTLWLRQPQ
jgi:hypothetical protein